MNPRIALAHRRRHLLDVLFGPFRHMVAWAEPWDLEDDCDDPA
ncbi:MAG TPA: hypothetical protein VGO92_09235 [Acidimicrobiales bacterium]|jgi:hypothetical protein|nr:hypothetical protein [Acidimicrobiales bacterium]